MTSKKLTYALWVILISVCICITTISYVSSGSRSSDSDSLFNTAVEIIKKYEGLHSSKHWPYIGYGHQVIKGEKYRRGVVLKQDEAEELLRKDLKKYIGQFRQYGADSILLGVLAYNIGVGNVRKSSLTSLLDNESKLRETYLAHCRYRGKIMTQIQRRRQEEFDTLYPLIREAEERSKNLGKIEEIASKDNKSLSWLLVSDPGKIPDPKLRLTSSGN